MWGSSIKQTKQHPVERLPAFGAVVLGSVDGDGEANLLDYIKYNMTGISSWEKLYLFIYLFTLRHMSNWSMSPIKCQPSTKLKTLKISYYTNFPKVIPETGGRSGHCRQKRNKGANPPLFTPICNHMHLFSFANDDMIPPWSDFCSFLPVCYRHYCYGRHMTSIVRPFLCHN